MSALPEWAHCVLDACKTKGFDSIRTYLIANQGTSYGTIADQLGGLSVPLIYQSAYQEAISTNSVRECAMDSIVRVIRSRTKRGWRMAPRWESRSASIFAEWFSQVPPNTGDAHIDQKLNQTWEALHSLSPPDGWLPESAEDSYLRTAFEMGWPEREDRCDL